MNFLRRKFPFDHIIGGFLQILSKNDHSGLDRIFKRRCFQWQLHL